jgi:anti-anti-sigma regulatory factor
VLQVRDGLLIVPIIGALDDQRARQLTEQLLDRIRYTRSRLVVIDVTGVPVIDSNVANHLVQTVEASRLMGAGAIITGLTSVIAQSLVTIGVDLSKMNAVGDLQGESRKRSACSATWSHGPASGVEEMPDRGDSEARHLQEKFDGADQPRTANGIMSNVMDRDFLAAPSWQNIARADPSSSRRHGGRRCRAADRPGPSSRSGSASVMFTPPSTSKRVRHGSEARGSADRRGFARWATRSWCP